MRACLAKVVLALLIGASASAWSAPVPAAAFRATAQAGTATLSIISGQIQVGAPGGGAFGPATDGQTLAIGARVRTAPDSRAVLTFFDGTTAALEPNTEITLDRVQPSGEQPGGLAVGIGLTAGRVWTQVTSLFNRGSSFEVQAAGATAVAREGVTGFGIDADGVLWCWDIAGQPLRVRTAAGDAVITEGQQVGIRGGAVFSGAAPREFGAGVLEVTTEGAVVPWLVTPVKWTVGFPLSDLVVNQVQDATTSSPSGPARWVRLPGPRGGDYSLVLQAVEAGPYRARVTLSVDGNQLFSRELSGTVGSNDRLLAALSITTADRTPSDSAPGVGTEGQIPTGARLGDPQPLMGTPPGNFIYP